MNGVWLPGRQTIDGWGGLKKIDGWQKQYVENAMEAHGYQFRDNHVHYSDSVLDELKEIEKKIKQRAMQCEMVAKIQTRSLCLHRNNLTLY